MLAKYSQQQSNQFLNYFNKEERNSLISTQYPYWKIRLLVSYLISLTSDKLKEKNTDFTFLNLLFGSSSSIVQNYQEFISKFLSKVYDNYNIVIDKMKEAENDFHFLINTILEQSPSNATQTIKDEQEKLSNLIRSEAPILEYAESSVLSECLLIKASETINIKLLCHLMSHIPSDNNNTENSGRSSKTELPINFLIPEIRKMSKSIIKNYNLELKSLSKLSDTNLMFINVFKHNFESSLINGLVYFPFSPLSLLSLAKEANHSSFNLILLLSKFFKLSLDNKFIEALKEETESVNNKDIDKTVIKINIIKQILTQKILDIFYAVQDSEDLHGVLDCHSNFDCREKASSLCNNFMCKKCCQNSRIANYCSIHHNRSFFFRNSLSNILKFERENSFNPSLTLRIKVCLSNNNQTSLKKTVDESDLNSTIESYIKVVDFISTSFIKQTKHIKEINDTINAKSTMIVESSDINKLNNMKIKYYYHNTTGKIEFLYLCCSSNLEAKKIYENKEKINERFKEFDISIAHIIPEYSELLEDCNKTIIKYKESKENQSSKEEIKLEYSGLLVFPLHYPSNFKDISHIPKKTERLRAFQLFIEHKLSVKSNEYMISNLKNYINGNLSYTYFLISFNSYSLLNKFYHFQPFFKSVVFHKLTHLNLFPVIIPKDVKQHILKSKICIGCDRKIERNNDINEKDMKTRDCIHELCRSCCNKSAKNAFTSRVKEALKKQNIQCSCINSNNELNMKTISSRKEKTQQRKYDISNLTSLLSQKPEADYNHFSNTHNTDKESQSSKCSNCLIGFEYLCKNHYCDSCCENSHCCCSYFNIKTSLYRPYHFQNIIEILEINKLDEFINNKETDFTRYENQFNRSYELLSAHIWKQTQNLIIETKEKLKNSNFDFYRPISNNSYSRLSKDMNKEFTIVMDNPNFKRDREMTINDRMYKSMSFQNIDKKINSLNSNLSNSTDMEFNLKGGFDNKGQYYLEMNGKNTNNSGNITNYEISNENSHSQINTFQYEAIKKKSYVDFHLIIYGLDLYEYSANELVEEIFSEIKSKDIRLLKDNINVIHEGSLLSKFLYNIFPLILYFCFCFAYSDHLISTHTITKKSIYDFKSKGRIVTIKFDHVSDALKIYLKHKTINLPLINKVKGSPKIVLSSYLEKEIINKNLKK